MDIHEAERRTRDHLSQHGLSHWGFIWLHTKRTLGICRYGTQEIGLNREWTVRESWEVVEQTVLHEIAHALAGPEAKHGPEWHSIALSIGVKNPAALAKEYEALPGRYMAVCGNCGRKSYRYRKTRRMNALACGDCCRKYAGGKYDRRFALTYVDTYVAGSSIVPDEPNTERIDMSESDSLSATQLAAQIGTDPKTLRRFLRENDSFRNPGSGKRYVFSAREAASVEKAFRAWDGKRSRRSQTTGDTRPKNKSERTAAEREKRAKERVDALETSLRARGVHIDQHR